MDKNEAIKMIKWGLREVKLNPEVKKALETLIPEIAETEDRKIIKSLIDNFKHYSCASDGTTSLKILDWLEKYCVPSENGEGIYYYKDGTFTFIGGYDTSKCEKITHLTFFDGYNEGRDNVMRMPEHYGLQKPMNWDEDDEQLFGFIFDLLESMIWRKDWAMGKEECMKRLNDFVETFRSSCNKKTPAKKNENDNAIKSRSNN